MFFKFFRINAKLILLFKQCVVAKRQNIFRSNVSNVWSTMFDSLAMAYVKIYKVKALAKRSNIVCPKFEISFFKQNILRFCHVQKHCSTNNFFASSKKTFVKNITPQMLLLLLVKQCFWLWPNGQTFFCKQISNVGPITFGRLARTLNITKAKSFGEHYFATQPGQTEKTCYLTTKS